MAPGWHAHPAPAWYHPAPLEPWAQQPNYRMSRHASAIGPRTTWTALPAREGLPELASACSLCGIVGRPPWQSPSAPFFGIVK